MTGRRKKQRSAASVGGGEQPESGPVTELAAESVPVSEAVSASDSYAAPTPLPEAPPPPVPSGPARRATLDDSIPSILERADELVAQLRYDDAEREYKRAQKLDPSRPDVHVQLGILYYKRGLYQQADVELKKATDLDPDNGTAFFYRGEAMNQMSRVDLALEYLTRAAQLQPANARAFYLMGILYDKKHMPEQAMAMYRKSREIARP